jgi:hypothetical protein
MACNRDVTLCMITKFINKWMFTFVNTIVPFPLCLHYARLSSYSTGCMQISNDAKLIMLDDASRTLSSISLRDPSNVGVVKSHVVVPHLHHLAHPSSWSNY